MTDLDGATLIAAAILYGTAKDSTYTMTHAGKDALKLREALKAATGHPAPPATFPDAVRMISGQPVSFVEDTYEV